MSQDQDPVGYASTPQAPLRPGNSLLSVVEPATGRSFASVPLSQPGDVERAIAGARRAFRCWRDTPAAERAAHLLRFAADLRANPKELATLVAREGGKVLAQAEWEVAWTADIFEYYAGMARNYAGRVIPPASAAGTSLVLKEPLGVVAAILPWNYPLLLWAWKAAPALAAGNCMVAKPSPLTPLSLLQVQERLHLPQGVHSVVVGGDDIGATLATHREVDAIAFTGTARAGKRVLQASVDSLKRIAALELSGQDSMIVWDDVDLDTAVEAACFAGFIHAGQVCTSTERLYVTDTIAHEFTTRLTRRARELRVGDPLAPDTQVGPLMTAHQRTRLLAYVTEAKARGAIVEAGGNAIGQDGGYYFEPTVLTNLRHEDLNSMGEIFGPILPVIPVPSFAEAIRLANDNPFGLGASVLTADLERALLAAHEIRAGSVWINSVLMDNNAGPFGGTRQSGFGREMGEEGFEAYLQTKHVSIDHRLTRQSWWF